VSGATLHLGRFALHPPKLGFHTSRKRVPGPKHLKTKKLSWNLWALLWAKIYPNARTSAMRSQSDIQSHGTCLDVLGWSQDHLQFATQ